MIWLYIIGLALLMFAVAALPFKVPRAEWKVIGAALLLGLAGYALQGSPRLPGAPKAPAETVGGIPADLIAARQQLVAGDIAVDKHLVIADALARHGQYADAAEILRGAVEADPANAGAWLAMANALVAHADGTLSPAALFAFGHAAKAAPDSPGPPFFLGMALIQSGRLGEGRALWADLLARSPKEAPWRGDLAKRLGELDAYLASQQAPQSAAPVNSQSPAMPGQ